MDYAAPLVAQCSSVRNACVPSWPSSQLHISCLLQHATILKACAAFTQVLRDRPMEALLVYFTVSAMHIYSIAQRTKAGSAERALACSPVLLINLFVPFLVDRHIEPCLYITAVFCHRLAGQLQGATLHA